MHAYDQLQLLQAARITAAAQAWGRQRSERLSESQSLVRQYGMRGPGNRVAMVTWSESGAARLILQVPQVLPAHSRRGCSPGRGRLFPVPHVLLPIAPVHKREQLRLSPPYQLPRNRTHILPDTAATVTLSPSSSSPLSPNTHRDPPRTYAHSAGRFNVPVLQEAVASLSFPVLARPLVPRTQLLPPHPLHENRSERKPQKSKRSRQASQGNVQMNKVNVSHDQ